MDEVTQQNAVLVEEAAASAEAIQEQAGSLTRAVSVFKLDTRRQGTGTEAVKPLPRQRLSIMPGSRSGMKSVCPGTRRSAI
jgi:hypothetical protein